LFFSAIAASSNKKINLTTNTRRGFEYWFLSEKYCHKINSTLLFVSGYFGVQAVEKPQKLP